MSVISVSRAAERITERAQLVANVVAVSETMLNAARVGNWHGLSEHEERRQQQTWQLFAEPFTALEAERYAADLERIHQMSQELTELADAQRSALREGLARLQHGRAAMKAYQRHGGSSLTP